MKKGGGYSSIFPELVREEGVLSLWKGNMAAVIRVVPYMSCTFFAYEEYKALLHATGGYARVSAFGFC